MSDIAIIDYGMGNVHSVQKAFIKIIDKHSSVRVTNNIDVIKDSSHIVFPGQGAANECMQNISKYFGLDELSYLFQNKPFLGICMGLQVLMTSSEENNSCRCLDILPGQVLGMQGKINKNLKIPHMGWNKVRQEKDHPIWNGIEDNSFFYFVHSYYVKPTNDLNVLSLTDYDISFASSVYDKNIVAVQFHPEKSSASGLKLLQNFINWNGEF